MGHLNMKFLVLAACVAVSSAALVTYPNGAVVPADTPEVAVAKAAHLGQLGHVLPVGYAGYPYPYALDTHTDLLPMPMELLSLLMSPLSMPPRLLMLLLEELSTPLESTVLLMPVLLPTPTVLLSQLSPLMLLPPVLSILLLLHLPKNHLVC